MSELWVSPFSLLTGDLIQVKVRASNIVGYGSFSPLNTLGATVLTKPSVPLSAPSRVDAGTSVS